jgi:S-adenosylmethionine:tRNA ribosyltransferase-isomerase
MKTADFDYYLPPHLIAQYPNTERTKARMMVLNKRKRSVEHRYVYHLPEYLVSGDILILNNTKVIPARLFGQKKAGGGKIEVFLLERLMPCLWKVLCKSSRPVKPGMEILLCSNRIQAVVEGKDADNNVIIRVSHKEPIEQIIEQEGHVPLPPYIKRNDNKTESPHSDKKRYQTVYASEPGAVAAPTAGLHFTRDLLEELRAKGVRIGFITLHVSVGTFRPVKADIVENHHMHAEKYEVNKQTADLINNGISCGSRIIAVGTTVVRTLESICDDAGRIRCGTGETSFFIKPGYRFRVVNALLTNFHLPKSTLLMMVSAFADTEFILKAYSNAIEMKYRFYSYGDCMLIF